MAIPIDKTWPYAQRCYVANRIANWPFLPYQSRSLLASVASMSDALRAIELITIQSAEFCELNRRRFEAFVDEVETWGGKSATPEGEDNG